MLEAIQTHVGVPDSDPEVAVFGQTTQPESLMRQVEAVIEREGGAGEDAHD